MADEIKQDIIYRYRAQGMNTISRRTRTLNRELGKSVTTMERFDRTTGTWVTTGKRISDVNTRAGRLSQGIGGLATRFVGLQAALMYAQRGFRQVTEWIKQSIEEFRSFEVRIAEINTILQGTNTTILPALAVGIENLSVRYGKGADDLAKGTYDILSAAFDARDALVLLNSATKASIAGLSDVETSVDVLTSILNAYGKTAYQAAQISDILFQTVIRGKLRYEDLASAMGYIAPIAANLGVEFEEVAAALTTVTRQGQHVDMATRGLALGIQNIADMTPQATEAARKYGVNLSQLALQVGGLEYVVQELNVAMKEHGAKILPEMISNMRSLRVFMALAGDEGVEGFTQDITLMEHAINKTEEAMSKMMATSERQAEVLSQSMQRIERSIGDAWSELDIWWKKTQVWWGTLLSGGDANLALENLDRHFTSLREQYAELSLAMDLGEKPLDLFTELGSLIRDNADKNLPTYKSELEDIIAKTVNWANVNIYLSEQFKKQDLLLQRMQLSDLSSALVILRSDAYDTASAMSALSNAGIMLDQKAVTLLRDMIGAKGAGTTLGPLGHYTPTTMYSIGLSKQHYDRLTKEETKAFLLFRNAVLDTIEKENIRKQIEDTIFKPFISGKMTFGEMFEKFIGAETAESAISGLIESIDTDLSNALSKIDNNISLVEDDFIELQGGLDSIAEGMQTASDNILSLENELMNLDIELHSVYETMSGQQFAGKLRWELAVSSTKTALDRFEHYSQMAIKYGDDMNTGFMSGMQGYINNMKKEFSDLKFDLPELDWLNEDIFSQIDVSRFKELFGTDALKKYDTAMEAIIDVMSKYGDTTEKIKEIELMYQKELNDIKKENMELDLQALEIQLKGMMRRRGNTRSEQKMLKKIQIEQTKNRIEQMEYELDVQKQTDAEMTSEMEEKYEEASNIYDEYVDRVKNYLWEIQDARDSELRDFVAGIATKEGYFNLYRGWLQDNKDTLDSYALALETIANKVDTEAPDWETYFEKDPIKWANDTITNIREELETIQGISGGTAGGGEEEGGGGGTTPPEPEPEPKPERNLIKKYVRSGLVKFYALSSAGSKKWWEERNSRARDQLLREISSQYPVGSNWAWRRGTYYVPETRPAIVHRGEQIIPAGSSRQVGGGDVYITNEIHATINNKMDAYELGEELARGQRSLLINKKGKTTFKIR